MLKKSKPDKLIEEIGKLKEDLTQTYQKREKLSHPEVLAISSLLDEKITQYIQYTQAIFYHNDFKNIKNVKLEGIKP